MLTATRPPLQTTGIELFKAGSRRDSQGRERAWTIAELDEMAAAYNEIAGNHDAPILIGHDGNTSYGWLMRAYRQGEVLFGDYKEVEPNFAQAVNAGRYKKRSISIYPPEHPDNPTPGRFNIRHVAYVGIPAVKGLKDHVFNDSGAGFLEYEAMPMTMDKKKKKDAVMSYGSEEDFLKAWGECDKMDDPTAGKKKLLMSAKKQGMKIPKAAMMWAKENDIEFNETEFEFAGLAQVAGILQSIRDQMIDDKGIDAAEQAIPKAVLESLRAMDEPMPTMDDFRFLNDRVSELMQMVAESRSNPMPNYTEPDMTQPKPETNPDLAVQFAEMQTTMAAMRTELDTVKIENASLKQANALLAHSREVDRITNFVESLIHDRKVLPVEKQQTIELALAMPNDSELDFTEGESTVKKTPRQQYLDSLAARKELYSNSPMRTGAKDAPTDFAEQETLEGYDSESVKLDRKVRTLMAEKNIDYNEALDLLVQSSDL